MKENFTDKEEVEFYYKLIHDVTDRYWKTYAFFLAINAAVFGYAFSSNLEIYFQKKSSLIDLILCILFC